MGVLKDHWIEYVDPLSSSAAAESGRLKQILKHSPNSDLIEEEAAYWDAEAEEAIEEVEKGFDTCSPGSWVDRRLD